MIAFITLEDMERIEGWKEREAELQRAMDLSLAFHDPKTLSSELRHLQGTLETDTTEDAPSREELRQAMHEMGQRLRTIVPTE